MRKLKKGRARRYRLKWKRRGLLANHRHYLYLAEQAMLAEMRKDLIGFASEPK